MWFPYLPEVANVRGIHRKCPNPWPVGYICTGGSETPARYMIYLTPRMYGNVAAPFLLLVLRWETTIAGFNNCSAWLNLLIVTLTLALMPKKTFWNVGLHIQLLLFRVIPPVRGVLVCLFGLQLPGRFSPKQKHLHTSNPWSRFLAKQLEAVFPPESLPRVGGINTTAVVAVALVEGPSLATEETWGECCSLWRWELSNVSLLDNNLQNPPGLA